MLFNLIQKRRKIIVRHNGREFTFHTLIGALRFIKYMSEDKYVHT